MLSLLILRIKRIKDDIPLILIMTLMVIGLTAIFGSSFNSGFQPKILLVDKDNTIESQELLNEIRKIPNYDFNKVDYDEGIQEVKEWDAFCAIILDKSISNDKFSIDIFVTKDSLELIQLENSIKSKMLQVKNKILLTDITYNMIDDKRVDYNLIKNNISEDFDFSWKYKRPMITKLNMLDQLNMNKYDVVLHYLVGFTLFFSTYVIVFGAAEILKEKQDNTLHRQLVSPLKKSSILLTHLLITFLVGFLQVFILVILGKYLIGIAWGDNVGTVLAIYSAFVFCITCLGLFISGIVKTHEQLSSITPVILTSSAMLGGCMWPLEIISSKVLLVISNFMPHKWALHAIEGIVMYNADPSSSYISILVLLVMGIIYFLLGLRIMKVE